MALSKTPTKIINAVTVAGNATSSASSGVDLSTAVDLNIGYTLQFASGATGTNGVGARIDVYQDPAGASASFTIGSNDNPVYSHDIPVKSGVTVSGGFQCDKSAKFIQIKIVNLDTTHAITGASVWATPQVP